MDNFLWRKVDEKELQKIKEEAKRIMDNFASALEKVEHLTEEQGVKRSEQFREEESAKTEKSFREIFFHNAEHEKDFVKGEKGKWK